MPTTHDATNATDPTATPCAAVSRAPLTCRQALAATLLELTSLRAKYAEALKTVEQQATDNATLSARLSKVRASRDDYLLRLRVIMGDADDPASEEVAPEAAF